MYKIKRNLYDKIKKHLNAREISVIIGPRQTGKTTIMKALKDELEKRGEKTLFFNLDWESDNLHFDSQEKLLNKIKLEIGNKRGYVFIDEVQRKENAGIFLKGIYDKDFSYKFIVSGSGSIELKDKIHESLIGRKRLFTLLPVTFKEFVNFKTNYRFEKREHKFLEIERIKSEALLNEYLAFGGYPRVVTEDLISNKLMLLEEIFKSYIERDIVYLLKVDRPDSFSQLIKILSAQIGRLLNYSEIASNVGISVPTLKKYLWFAEKTFIVKTIAPFYKNLKKEIIKARNIYFYDTGMRNFAIGNNSINNNHSELGFLFQNFVGNLIEENLIGTSGSINFWRTTDKAEVDFVVNVSNEKFPVEVKFTKYNTDKTFGGKLSIPRSLRSFIEKYSPIKAYIVNLNLSFEKKINNTIVEFLPYYQLINNDFNFGK